MSPEALGKAQAVVTIVTVLGSVPLLLWWLAVRARAKTTRNHPLAWTMLVFFVGIGLAMVVIGLLQLAVDPAPYAVINVLIGVSILLAVIRSVVRVRQ